MPVVGLQFNKIVVEKTAPVKGKIKVNNNVILTDVEKTDLTASKQGALKFYFEFTANYDPKIGDINLNGFLTFVDKAEICDEVAKSWKKDKKVPKEIMSSVLNTVLSRCNIEALLFSREVNLPPPIPLPKVNVK
ncbi:hypothetical protein COV18_00225 [Candidatus Woesearchaeota archaeon CG10_big_fil_rev_8_21_14_0_10_37_12]|nr:MAG: hypothetical protein COV18_00225 [Candidatus Woesearchaeota archaeon CG10_big_fil_rev_8_21_14_0_10_37_12]